MVTAKIKQLEATKAKLARLEQSVAAALRSELAGLPSAYGFDSARSFTRAVLAAAGGRGGKSGGKRRKRAVITDATRGLVKKLAEAGKTGAEIAREAGI